VGQLGFFDLNRRYESLDEKGDPLVAIAAIVPCDSFRGKLKAALIKGELRKNDAERKSWAGRKPWDAVVVFRRWCCRRSIISRTIRRNISFAIASRSRGF
jgi:IS5 family transposase